uniref:Family with sequence similarity 220 member A n=1 Tax=Catagonus wagneri TaxID=51154 RepID=A0A8C3W7C7_9CETA
MRDGRGTLGTRLAEEKGAGGDSGRLLFGLEQMQESPLPSDTASRVNKPVVAANGNAQNGELSLEMEEDLSEVGLLLQPGNGAPPHLQKSTRRNSASAAAQSETVGLLFASPEECFAGVSCGVGDAQMKDSVRGGPRASDGCRGRSCRGGPWGSGLPGRQKPSEAGISADEPPSALLERLDSELEPSCLRSILSTLLHAHPHVFLNDEKKHLSPGHSKPKFSEPTVEYKKMLSHVISTSDGLQRALALPTPQAFESVNLLCRSQ